ncbi:MAG: hypothetical protein JWO90_1714, partial [Solirubrobacterales bacterium]|nr:hypothetical protein [Solirubrobacterales bacterium]
MSRFRVRALAPVALTMAVAMTAGADASTTGHAASAARTADRALVSSARGLESCRVAR